MGGVVKSVGKAIGGILGGASAPSAPRVVDTTAQEIRRQTAMQEQRALEEQAVAQKAQAETEERRRRQLRSGLQAQPSLFDVMGAGQQSGGTLG